MRYVIALGGNALLQRSERPDAGIQRHHVKQAAAQLAPLLAGHEVFICHGNGPQIGMLAQESEDDPALALPFPLDTLGAQTQGMIGYWLAQELANAGVTAPIAVILTQTLVDQDDPAFAAPTKFIGPTYTEAQAEAFAEQRGWSVAPDTGGWRRVVASPEPRRLLELPTIAALATTGTLVVCAGGGGIPVVRDENGLRGIEAVVDKDLTAALLATSVDADRLVLLTDIRAVMRNFGRPDQSPLSDPRRRTRRDDLPTRIHGTEDRGLQTIRHEHRPTRRHRQPHRSSFGAGGDVRHHDRRRRRARAGTLAPPAFTVRPIAAASGEAHQLERAKPHRDRTGDAASRTLGPGRRSAPLAARSGRPGSGRGDVAGPGIEHGSDRR